MSKQKLNPGRVGDVAVKHASVASAYLGIGSERSPVIKPQLELWAGGRANVSFDLHCRLDPTSKALRYRGDIIGFGPRETRIGQVEAVMMSTFDHSPRDVLGEEFRPLFNKRGNLIKAAEDRVADGTCILLAFFLTHLSLIREVRGHNLELHIVDRLLQMVALNSGYAVLRASATESDELYPNARPPLSEATHGHANNSALGWLVEQWQRIDFERVPGTDLMVRDLGLKPRYRLAVPHYC